MLGSQHVAQGEGLVLVSSLGFELGNFGAELGGDSSTLGEINELPQQAQIIGGARVATR